MFRITKDDHLDGWYVHKKFLFWWIKFGYPISNRVSDIRYLPKLLKHGSYNFKGGEYGNYFYIVDKKYCTIEYYKDEAEFIHKNAESLI